MTVVFLDIDGVLNPYKAKHPQKHSPDYRKVPIPLGNEPGVLRPWASTEHGFRFEPFRVVWATTWVWYPDMLEAYAEASGFPQGLERIEFDMDEHEVGRGCGKLPGVQRWLEENPDVRRFVWIDDLLGTEDFRWASGYEALLLKTDPAVGLTPNHYKQINDFGGAR